jgi:3-dehydroquinate synthase
MAEVIKSAGLAGGALLRQLSQVGDHLSDVDQSEIVDLVNDAVAYKAAIVGRDERDIGVRLRLNFGHTIGHAIEQSLSFKRLTHGEAVILGMIGAMAIADRLGVSHAKLLGEFRRIVISSLSLLPSVRLDPDQILGALALDKKRTTKGIRFVLLPAPGHPVVRIVSRREVTAAIEAMIQIYQAR